MPRRIAVGTFRMKDTPKKTSFWTEKKYQKKKTQKTKKRIWKEKKEENQTTLRQNNVTYSAQM